MVILRTVLIVTLDRYQAVVSKLEHGMVETLRVEGGERAPRSSSILQHHVSCWNHIPPHR
jgi:hypothetical protein